MVNKALAQLVAWAFMFEKSFQICPFVQHVTAAIAAEDLSPLNRKIQTVVIVN